MRRVGGYNLDVFHPQSERPYTADGSVNSSHLLVGSEGTLAWTRTLTLKLAPLPKHKALGVVSFPTLYRAMELTQHIVKLGPAAVELVDRTMIELARGNPAFRPVIDAALVGEPDAILLVEFVGEDADAPRRRLEDLVALMGDLGLPGQVVRMPDARPAEGAVGRPQGGPEHHDEHEGRRQAGVLHRGLRGAARAPGRLHRRGSPRCSSATARAAPGTRTRRSARCTCARSSTCGATARRRCARSRRRPPRWCGSTRARTRASTATAWCAPSGSRWQFGPRLTRAFEEVKALFDPDGPDEPRQDRPRHEDGRREPVPLSARLRAA